MSQVALMVVKCRTLRGTEGDAPLTIAAPSFINDTFLPSFAARSKQAIRSLRLPTALLAEYAAERIIDAAISIGLEAPAPRSWSSELVGEVQYGLFASPTRIAALGPAPTMNDLRAVPFVTPLYLSRSGAVENGDD